MGPPSLLVDDRATIMQGEVRCAALDGLTQTPEIRPGPQGTGRASGADRPSTGSPWMMTTPGCPITRAAVTRA